MKKFKIGAGELLGRNNLKKIIGGDDPGNGCQSYVDGQVTCCQSQAAAENDYQQCLAVFSPSQCGWCCASCSEKWWAV